MKVWILTYDSGEYYDFNVETIGVYSSEENAKQARDRDQSERKFWESRWEYEINEWSVDEQESTNENE